MNEIKDWIKNTIKSYEKTVNDACLNMAKAEAKAEAYGCMICELRDLLIMLEKKGSDTND